MHISFKTFFVSCFVTALVMMPFLAHAQMQPLAFVTSSNLPDATVGQAYDTTLEVSGGVAPYTFETSALGQPLPQWMSLNSNGQLTGAAEAGQYAFTIVVRDSDGDDQTNLSGDFTLNVTPIAPPPAQLTVLGPNRTDGVVGEILLPIGITVSGGVPNYTWNVTGNLPPGVELLPLPDTPDFSFMTLSGTPTQAGEFAFTLSVNDSSQPPLAFSKDVTFTIAAAPGEVPPGEMPPAEPPVPPLVPQAQPYQFTATIFSGLIGTWNCTIDINGALTEVLATSTCNNVELVGQDALLGANGDILFDQGSLTIDAPVDGVYRLKGFARLRGPLAGADDEALKIYFDRSDNPVSLRPIAGQENQNNALLEGVVTSGYFGEASLSSAAQLLAICGDFQVGIGEQCDDGNQNNFDLCSNMCRAQGVLPPGINGLPYVVRFEQFYNVITTFAGLPLVTLPDEPGFMTAGVATTGNYEGTLTTNEGNVIPTAWTVTSEESLRVPEGKNKFEFIQEMVQKVKNNELTFTGEKMVDILYVIHAVNMLQP